jgi:antitoxin component YwqK of YwqJK toxin-antitoxin module
MSKYIFLSAYKPFVNAFMITLVFNACTQNKENNSTQKSNNSAPQNYQPKHLKDTIGGVYHEYYSNGNIKIKGVLKNGKRDGDWSYFYENGRLWSWGEYTDGVRNGASSVYYINGILKLEGNYVNDKKSGVWKFYDKDGKLIKEVNFDKENEK